MAGTFDHTNIQPQAIVIIIVFPVIATIAVALRLYSRSLTRTFGLDDWFICAAGIIYWGETYTSYFFIKFNYIGYHVYDIPAAFDSVAAGKYLYATEILYNPILALIKTSILLFLLRLTGQKRAVTICIWTLLIINTLMMITVFLLTIFQCLPISAAWDATTKATAKCLDFASFVTGTAAISIITDGLVLILPTWIVYDLHIQRRQKLMLIGILSFGLITVISGMVRMVLLNRFDRDPGPDPTYTLIFCTSTIEIGLAFVAACAPYMKAILIKIVPKIFGSRNGRYETSTGRPSRMAYELGEGPHVKSTQNNIQIDASGELDPKALENGMFQSQNAIVLVTEKEVKWQQSNKASFKTGNSTDSLV